MTTKQLAATALILVTAVLSLYLGVRLINSGFDAVAKRDAVQVQPAVDDGYDKYCYEVGSKVYYYDMAACHKLAAEGKNMITSWRKH